MEKEGDYVVCNIVILWIKPVFDGSEFHNMVHRMCICTRMSACRHFTIHRNTGCSVLQGM